MLVYWGLDHPLYANVSGVAIARKGLAHSYAKMWMETAWRPSHTVCENYVRPPLSLSLSLLHNIARI